MRTFLRTLVAVLVLFLLSAFPPRPMMFDPLGPIRLEESPVRTGPVSLTERDLVAEKIRAIPNPFDASLFAQPNRASIRLVAPYRVTVGATAVQLTASGNVHGLVVKALSAGQTIYLGVSSAVTTANGYPMAHYETLTLEVRNANELYAIASAADQAVAVLPFSRY